MISLFLLYIAEVVQWNWPATRGENVHVVMLGSLHIEIVLCTMCGDLLPLSGWTTALTETEIASSGTSDFSLMVAQFTKTKCAHQVTAAVLYKLRHLAFQELISQQDEEEFQKWHKWPQRKLGHFKVMEHFFKHPNGRGTRAE